jgi:hypothetical protein
MDDNIALTFDHFMVPYEHARSSGSPDPDKHSTP